MKLRNAVQAAVIVLALGLGACQNKPAPPAPTQIDIDVNNTNTNNIGTGAPGTGTPGAPGTCAVAALKGGIYGDRGGSACSGRVAGQLKVGCEVDLTVTPKKADGSDASPIEHGQNVSISESSGAENATLGEDSSNPFNYTVRGDKAGPYQVRATLNAPGCPTLERTYDFTVGQ